MWCNVVCRKPLDACDSVLVGQLWNSRVANFETSSLLLFGDSQIGLYIIIAFIIVILLIIFIVMLLLFFLFSFFYCYHHCYYYFFY